MKLTTEVKLEQLAAWRVTENTTNSALVLGTIAFALSHDGQVFGVGNSVILELGEDITFGFDGIVCVEALGAYLGEAACESG